MIEFICGSLELVGVLLIFKLKKMEIKNMQQNGIETKERLAYSVEELSEMTSLSKEFLRKEIKAKNLKAKTFGRRVLVLNESWQAYQQSREDWVPNSKREMKTNEA
jgi:hypothetical protein